MIGNRSRSFRHVNVGQTVTRVVAGEGPTRLRVTSVDRRLIHCGDLTFERDLGLEVDPVLGPSLWGAVHSRLQPEPRRVVVRGAVSLRASIRRVLQITLFVTYLIVLAGISFTWWGRLHLGKFWSNTITHKEDHRVVDTGPYGIVRHPIYTGLIAGMLATGIAVGTVTAILGAILISLGMWQKGRMEEVFLSKELGEDAYGAYCRRVPMIIPFLSPR